VRHVCSITAKLGRSLLINTGGHGTLYGSGPNKKGLGEAKFILEDI